MRSPQDLSSWLRSPPPVEPQLREQRLAFVEEMLGPFDGKASTRTLRAIHAEAECWSGRARSAPQRRKLDRKRLIARPLLLSAAGAQAAVAWVATAIPGRVGASAAFRLPALAERLNALRRAG
jgi:hypothetical protein